MNKLLIQNLNDKFINNLSLCNHRECSILTTDIRGSLYKIYSYYNFTHIIFIDSLLDIESLQFIEEFGSEVKIFVYLDSDSTNYKQIKKNITILSYTKIENSTNKTIKIPILVNADLYFKTQTEKQEQIVSFIEKVQTLPENLQNYLYPQNSSLKIKLFNNNNIVHPQNLGLVSEQDKASLLQNSKYYLALTDDYVAEAWACGCEVLAIEDLTNLKSSKYKNSNFFQPYNNFLKGLISVKK